MVRVNGWGTLIGDTKCYTLCGTSPHRSGSSSRLQLPVSIQSILGSGYFPQEWEVGAAGGWDP